jgi:type VI secretion system protein ImpJ
MTNPGLPRPRIQWHEGMLLSPQHFQQESARVDALLAWQMLTAVPFAWGIRRLKIDTALLAAGTLRISLLEGVLPDGTAVAYNAQDALHGVLELDLAPFGAAMSSAALDVYLVLPVSPNMRTAGAPSRYRSVSTNAVEDEVSEALPADVPRLLPNLALVAGAAPSGLFSGFRLASVFKDNEVIKLGPVLPPLLEVSKEGDLWERLAGFVSQLRGKAAFVAKQTAVPSSRTEDRLAYLEQRERLRNLMTGLPLVEAVMRTPALHPYSLFLSLCSLLGPLSLLRPGGLPPVPPEYNHADPLAALDPVLVALQGALDEISQDYREFKFEYRHGAFELVLQSEWLTAQLVVGLRGQPERELTAWMDGAIVGSQSTYGSLRERRVLGAERSFIEASQELGVRASAGYTLFSIKADEMLILVNEALVISNAAESAAAQRPQEMVLFVKG